MKWFHLGVQSGDQLVHGQHRITPQSLVAWLRIPWPGGGHMFVYQHPLTVEVQTGDAPSRRLPIIDITLLTTTSMFLAALVAATFIIWRINHE